MHGSIFFKPTAITSCQCFFSTILKFYYCYHKKINISIFRRLFIEAQRNVDIQLHLQKYSCPSWQFQKSSDRPKAEHNWYSTLYNISPISFSSLFSPEIARFKQWISFCQSKKKKPYRVHQTVANKIINISFQTYIYDFLKSLKYQWIYQKCRSRRRG